MKIDKTPLSWVCQFRAFGRDFIFGYIKIAEAVDIAESSDEESANIILHRKVDE